MRISIPVGGAFHTFRRAEETLLSWAVESWWAPASLVLAGWLVGRGLRLAMGSTAFTAEVFLSVLVLLLLCLAPLLLGVRTGTLDLLELGVDFPLVFFVYFGARALWILQNPGALAAYETPHPSVVIAGLPQALWYGNLGMAVYLAAYRAPLPAWRVRLPRVDEKIALPPALLAAVAAGLYVLGFLARIPDLAHGWFMSWQAGHFASRVPPLIHSLTYFSSLAEFGYALAFLAVYISERPSLGLLVLAAALTVLEVLFSLLNGSKFVLATLLIIPLILRHYLRRRLGPASVAVAAAVFMFAIVPAVGIYREVANYERLSLRTFATEFPRELADGARTIGRLSPTGYIEKGVRDLMTRVTGADGMAVVVRGVPLVTGYAHGSSLVWVVKILVPTAVWPSKYGAVEATTRPINRLFGAADFSAGISVIEVAEFYWNFGLLGVVLGMGLVGLLQRTLVSSLVRSVTPLRAFTYAVLWPWMIISVDEFVYSVYSNVLRLLGLALLVSWVMLWLAQRSRRRLPVGAALEDAGGR